MNHKKVKRLIVLMGLYGKIPREKYKSYKGDFNTTVGNQLLDKVIDEEQHKTYYKRNFITEKCNEKWSCDVSEFHIATGKLYLSPIIDLHSQEIISYRISKSRNFNQTLDMLELAFQQYPKLHADMIPLR